MLSTGRLVLSITFGILGCSTLIGICNELLFVQTGIFIQLGVISLTCIDS